MKDAVFHRPGSLFVQRSLQREGPSPVFIAWKPHSSRLFYERSPLLKFVGWPASTPTGRELRDWLDSFEKTEPKPELDMKEIQATGWGPEAHEQDPTAQTKTII